MRSRHLMCLCCWLRLAINTSAPLAFLQGHDALRSLALLIGWRHSRLLASTWRHSPTADPTQQSWVERTDTTTGADLRGKFKVDTGDERTQAHVPRTLAERTNQVLSAPPSPCHTAPSLAHFSVTPSACFGSSSSQTMGRWSDASHCSVRWLRTRSPAGPPPDATGESST